MKESLFTYTVYDAFQFYTEILFKMLKNGFVCWNKSKIET